MSIIELERIKRWQVAHRAQQPLEYHTWDVMLTLWLMGWVGLCPVLLFNPWLLPLCALGICTPGLYVYLRQQAHQRRKLRCDWAGL
jgi:hypothetical protein